MKGMRWEAIAAGLAVAWILMWFGGIRDWGWFVSAIPVCVFASWLEARIGARKAGGA